MTERPDVAAYFGGRRTYYDSRYDALTADGHALQARLEATVSLIGEGPGAALDAGMGPGRLCAELQSGGWVVSGIDASPQMVEAARARLPGAAHRLQCAVIEELPFANESFDCAVATGVLEYADLRRALTELARVLRTSGLAVISYPNPHALYGIWKAQIWYSLVRRIKRLARRPEHWLPRGGQRVSEEQLRRLLDAAGFTVEAVQYTSCLAIPAPVDTLLPRLSWRIGRALEGSRPGVAKRFATQIVYAARKR